MRFKEGQGNGRRPKLVLVFIYHFLGSQGFQNSRIHGECMNKTKLSFIPLFLMHGSLYHDISEKGRTLGPLCPSFTPLGTPGPLKPPDFQNVIEASSAAPIWKSLGQGKILVPPRSIFDPLGTPLAPLNFLNVAPLDFSRISFVCLVA